ncbi:MAG: hypothetical protein E7272_07520 [Pseudobutyrivibrio ruminis]|uniref:Uncharacterized protein n=1 Tax=Pseudobutyrivibrio ruminis TaxID=46206 RepID=A0A927YLI3_9FIRM|nr:hypothetical protein [Pseudobutyrivibrio ruminis]
MLDKKTIFAVIEMLFIAVTVGLILFSPTLSLITAIVLYLQNTITCLKALDDESEPVLIIVNFVTLIADAILVLCCIGAYNDIEVLTYVVRYCSLICYFRSFFIMMNLIFVRAKPLIKREHDENVTDADTKDD